MFKKIVMVLAVFVASSVFADGGVHWAKNYAEGIKQASTQHKPVLFIISSHSCKYCLLLERTTLADKKVVKALNKDFIAIRSWTDQGDYIPQMIAQNTPGLPGIWFLYSNGDPMYQPLLGYVKTPNFLQALGVVKEEFDKNKGKKK